MSTVMDPSAVEVKGDMDEWGTLSDRNTVQLRVHLSPKSPWTSK